MTTGNDNGPSDEDYAELAKIASTPEGQIRVQHFTREFARVAEGYAHESTRPQAEAMMKAWAESADPLHKGLAQHWIAHARATVTGGMKAGKDAQQAASKTHRVLARIIASKKKRPAAA